MQRSGSAISSREDTSPPALSMSEASSNSTPNTSGDSLSSTLSPALPDGPMPCALPDGPMTDLFGQALVPVSPSVRRLEAGTLAGKTIAISGPLGDASSLNARLALSLASRLPLPGTGSMASAMTWKAWVTPSGRRFSRLAVSVSTMRALGFSLFATPTASANQSCRSMQKWPGCRGIVVTPGVWRRRMGLPIDWQVCAPTVTRSSRPSRRNSSGQQ